MAVSADSDDVMNKLAGVAPGSALAELRAERSDVVRFTQASDDAVFRPATEAGLSRAERAAAGLRIARLLRDGALEAHYQELLRPIDPDGRLASSVLAKSPPAAANERWGRILAHIDRVTLDPESSQASHIGALADAGLSPQAVVALSQVIAYVNFQARVRAGLAMLGGKQ